jgi:hypothetical protein
MSSVERPGWKTSRMIHIDFVVLVRERCGFGFCPFRERVHVPPGGLSLPAPVERSGPGSKPAVGRTKEESMLVFCAAIQFRK